MKLTDLKEEVQDAERKRMGAIYDRIRYEALRRYKEVEFKHCFVLDNIDPEQLNDEQVTVLLADGFNVVQPSHVLGTHPRILVSGW